MGCFTTICALSGQRIYRGDQVRLFLMELKDTKGGLPMHTMCYPTDLCKPVALPIKGRASDYGGLTVDGEIDPSVSVDILAASYRRLMDRDQVKGLAHDQFNYPSKIENPDALKHAKVLYDAGRFRFDADLSDIENFLSMVREARFGVGFGTFTDVWVTVMAHEEFCSALPSIALGGKAQEWADEATNALQKYVEYAEIHVPKWRVMKEKGKNIDFAACMMSLRNFAAESYMCEEVALALPQTEIGRFFQNNHHVEYEFRRYSDWVMTRLETGEKLSDDPTWLSLRGELVEFYMLMVAVEHMEMTFTPQRASGQGYESPKQQLAWLELQANRLKTYHEDRKAQGYGYDDEEEE